MYYLWRAWRLAGGLPSRRPAGLPTRIPTLWWVRLALYRTRHPVVTAPPLGSIGWGLSAVFNSPQGGIEDVSGMHVRGGVRTAFLNIREIDWSVIRQLWANCNSTVIPWQRCYTKADVEHLIVVADAWSDPGIAINFEPGADTSLTVEEIADAIKGYTGLIYLMVSPWMENDPPWSKLSGRCVFLIEGFTNERDYLITDLVEHAHKLGALQVAVMAGVYPAVFSPPASLLEWRQHWAGVPVILYLGDNLGADMTKWSAWNPLTP